MMDLVSPETFCGSNIPSLLPVEGGNMWMNDLARSFVVRSPKRVSKVVRLAQAGFVVQFSIEKTAQNRSTQVRLLLVLHPPSCSSTVSI